jgi:hypothetical protein
MPIPKPGKKEDKQNFVQRCMSNETMKKEYPDSDQRLAVCIGQTKSSIFEKMIGFLGWNFNKDCCAGYAEEIDCSNITIPRDEDYEDYEDEDQEEYDFGKMGCGQKGKYQYIDPDTREIYYFDQKRNYKKNNRYLRYVGIAKSAEYQGKKVTLNKPFRTPDGPKKFSVYVKNEKGNVVKVNFGDPNMKIKKNIPERRRSFRARHKCDTPGPKYKARYWSCKMW